MIAGGHVEPIFGVKAERQAVEDIATPLTVEDTRGGRKPRQRGIVACGNGQAVGNEAVIALR
jgi:hypothetical protein